MDSLLLHTCCAPCSIAVIDELRQGCDLSVFFYNPNIFPEDEYKKRKAEVVRVCREWGVPMIDGDYETEKWEKEAGHIGPDKEGGARCSACVRLRLTVAAECAKNGGFTRFATSLTSGRQKDSAVINAIGRAVGQQVGIVFLDTDWKKGGRSQHAATMVAERGIYRQNYCGCRFSLAARTGKRLLDRGQNRLEYPLDTGFKRG